MILWVKFRACCGEVHCIDNPMVLSEPSFG